MTGNPPHGPVRVLWLVKCLGLGGTEQLLLGAARVHDHSRVSITCGYIVEDDPAFVTALAETGVRPVCIGRRGRRLRWVPELWRLISSERFDVVHVHSPLIGSVARLMVRLRPQTSRPAVVTTEHNVWTAFHPLTRLANSLTIGGDDLVVAVSDACRRSMRVRVRERCEVLHHGVDVTSFMRQRERRLAQRPPLDVERPVSLLTVANFRRDKDYPNLLHALALLAKSGVPFRARLVGGGPLEGMVRGLVTELGLADLVELLGVRNDVPDLMAESDLLVVASSAEGLPVVVMESLAIGLPIVGTSVGGLPEALQGTGAAVLVPPKCPDQLAEAIGRIAADPRRQEAMRTAALASSSAFDVRRSTVWFEDRYEELARPDRIRLGRGIGGSHRGT